MVEPGGGLGLPLEAGVERGIAGEIGPQKFDRHPAAEPIVDALVHFCHAPTAEERTNLVRPDSTLGSVIDVLRLSHPLGSFSPIAGSSLSISNSRLIVQG